MSDDDDKNGGPDFGEGVASSSIAEGEMKLGHVGGEPVVLAHSGDEFFAIGAHCTHQGAPLSDGLLIDGSVRCPWHHACFDLRNGSPTRPPALKPVDCYRIEQRDGNVRVLGKIAAQPAEPFSSTRPTPANIVIVGGGAAGNMAAQTLRGDGYRGSITMLSADASPPYDRTNLSKGVLGGDIALDDNSLQPEDFYRENDIDLRLNTRVAKIDVASRKVETEDGKSYPYQGLLLATGAEPIKLDIPGAQLPHVRYLRSAADCAELLELAKHVKRAVVVGASFIGLEVAASLRARDIEVHVVGRETTLMKNVLGAAVGDYLQKVHTDHGVIFHLDTTASAISPEEVTLSNEETLAADLVVIGIGVRPLTALAEQAGLAVDHGVVVDEYLETSISGIFAAGDIARWPDPAGAQRVRIEHWVVAERLGQAAARNMLGKRERFDAVPFFWTEQYDLGVAYVGHAEKFDQVEIDGSLDERDCHISYRRKGRELAGAFIHRDLAGLHKEVEFEREISAKTPG